MLWHFALPASPPPWILSSLLGNKAGLALLLKLIGKKNDEIPALSILSSVMGGNEDSSGLLGSILGAVLK